MKYLYAYKREISFTTMGNDGIWNFSNGHQIIHLADVNFDSIVINNFSYKRASEYDIGTIVPQEFMYA